MPAKEKVRDHYPEGHDVTLGYEGIAAAGPVYHEMGMMPSRVVLRVMADGSLVTHIQAFERDTMTHQGFYYGNYFRSIQMRDAVEDFADRVARKSHPVLSNGL